MLNIGFWNAHSLQSTYKRDLVKYFMQEKELQLCGVAETWNLGHEGFYDTFIGGMRYIGFGPHRNRRGLAVVTHRHLEVNVMNELCWNCANSLGIVVQLCEVVVIIVYIPNGGVYSGIEESCDRFLNIYSNVNKPTIVLGDLNARMNPPRNSAGICLRNFLVMCPQFRRIPLNQATFQSGSTLDHIIASTNIEHHHFGVFEELGGESDHLPIFCSISSSLDMSKIPKTTINWCKAASLFSHRLQNFSETLPLDQQLEMARMAAESSIKDASSSKEGKRRVLFSKVTKRLFKRRYQSPEAYRRFKRAYNADKRRSWRKFCRKASKNLWHTFKRSCKSVTKLLTALEEAEVALEWSSNFTIPQTVQPPPNLRLFPMLPNGELVIPFVEKSELTRVIKKLPAKYSRGFDSITYNMIRGSPNVFQWLLDIMNCSLAHGTIPALWKLAKFVALPKPGSMKWRPISLLSNVAKTLERIVAGRMKQYIKNCDRQYASYGGTKMALNELSKFIQTHEQSKHPVYVVFFDVSKAFDRVHIPTLYRLLEGRLPEYLLRWVIHYFTDRKGLLGSSEVIIENGVPQGSVLGPIMFQLYIEDLLKGLHKDVYHALYADDFLIGIGGVTPRRACKILNESLRTIAKRCKDLCITLDTKKTCAMWLKKCTTGKKFSTIPLDLNNRRLIFGQNYKYLGVWIDSRLCFKKFIDQKLQKAKKRSALVFRMHGLTTAQYRTLWLGSVESYFRYGLEFILPFISDSLRDRLRGFYYSEARKVIGALKSTPGPDSCWLARLLDFDEYILFAPKHQLPKPKRSETLHLRPGLNARSIEINYVRWVTGHQWSRSYLRSHGMIPDGLCRYCNLELETREHILFDCMAPELRDACVEFLQTVAGIVGTHAVQSKNINEVIGSTYNIAHTPRDRTKIARVLFKYIQDIEYYT